ncbi:hypothetical protein, partial [Priestia megaterium]|uniref:hypothetical protein n=1 Tax=Priestia megaterium TaxID=1404 RepID=UPI001C9A21D6
HLYTYLYTFYLYSLSFLPPFKKIPSIPTPLSFPHFFITLSPLILPHHNLTLQNPYPFTLFFLPSPFSHQTKNIHSPKLSLPFIPPLIINFT